jgi:hypothetical protein
MLGIHIAAILTSILVLVVYGGVLMRKTEDEQRYFMFLIFMVMIPIFFITFFWVRMPLDFLMRLFITDPDIYMFLTNLYAPVTEELAKLAVIMLPFVWRNISRHNYKMAALAAGLGFGFGELWFVADMVAKNASMNTFAWYMYTGFMAERFLVCGFHAAFTLIALRYLLEGRKRGIFYAMGLHLIANFPIYLAAIDPGIIPLQAWPIILTNYLWLYAFAMVAIVSKVVYGKLRIGYMLGGKMICPGCGKGYDRPFWGVNMITKRYEKCPHCSRWHWVDGSDRLKE